MQIFRTYTVLKCLPVVQYIIYCKIWKKSGNSFRDIPWVTARFLEIVSGVCLYGLRNSGSFQMKVIWSPVFLKVVKNFKIRNLVPAVIFKMQ